MVAQSSCCPPSHLIPEWMLVPCASAPRTEEHGQSRINWPCWHYLPLLPPISSEQVPDAIKSQYQFPPPLIAPAAIRDGELICNGIPEESQMHLLNSEHLATQAEQQEVSEGRAGIPNLFFHPTAAVMEIASVSFPSPSSTTPPNPTLTPQEMTISGRTSDSDLEASKRTTESTGLLLSIGLPAL